jgi:hypothetical protein
MILNNIDLLLEEIQKRNTIIRVFKFGLLNTLQTSISRLLNSDVMGYFNSFLLKLDDAIVYFNSTGYVVNVNRQDIGDIYNIMNKIPDDLSTSQILTTEASQYLLKYFTFINDIIMQLVRPTIDNMVQSEFSINSITSLSSFANLNYDSKHYNLVSEVILEYQKLLLNKPTSMFSFSFLKRYSVDTTLTSVIMKKLETELLSYVRIKIINTSKVMQTITNN